MITDIVPIAGAAVLTYLGYLYTQYRTAEEAVYQRIYRRRFTKVLVGGLFGAYVIGVAFPQSGGWPADIGRGLGQTIGSSAPSIPTAAETTGLEEAIRWLKILGLVTYTTLWLAVSFSGQFAVKLYRLVFE